MIDLGEELDTHHNSRDSQTVNAPPGNARTAAVPGLPLGTSRGAHNYPPSNAPPSHAPKSRQAAATFLCPII
jgi:hypothetical protein